MIDVLLIFPRLGSMDGIVVDPPLSVIYAATDCVEQGFDTRILDLRLQPKDGDEALMALLEEGVRLVGISVMTGEPLHRARDLSRKIRAASPATKIVWGGPHVTVVPETIEAPYLDYLIRGYGSQPLAELTGALRDGRPDFEQIHGLSYRLADGTVRHNPRSTQHEMIHHSRLPYHLVDMNDARYVRSYNETRIFPLFSSIGCPYQCTFCMHPAVYKEINGPKWLSYPVEDVLDHMQMAKERFGAEQICFLDDTSFPDLERMRRLFEGVIERELNLTLEFRGARINEIERMDDEFLNLMIRAGTRTIMVGFESASDRILELMGKGITREQIFRVNRKLARFPLLTPIYNFFCGAPGETYEDLLETKDALLQVLEENPSAYVGVGGDWKPVPGTKMLENAVENFGYHPPTTVDEWAEVDTYEGVRKVKYPWYSKRHDNLIRILQAVAPVIDNKFIRESENSSSLSNRLIRLCARIYRPLALWRLRNNVFGFPVEFLLLRILMNIRQ